MKNKTKIILEAVLSLLRKSNLEYSCKEITIYVREHNKIRIAYRDMHLYLQKIRENLIVVKKGHDLKYRIDRRKKKIKYINIDL